MQVVRQFRRCLKFKNQDQLINKALMSLDMFMAMLCVMILTLSDNRSQCIASFYLFWALYFLTQAMLHYLLVKIPMIDVIKVDITIKRMIGLICFVEIVYMLLVVVFWQRSHVHPIYCAMCEEYQWPYTIGIVFIFHFILSAGFVISLIHLFVTRKYYLIALGGFQVQQRMFLEREQALRRIGLMEPNYAYPIENSIKSGKYYKFQDVNQNVHNNNKNNQQICSICLNKKLQQTQNIIKTSCNHYYHRSCIQTWATVNSRCPDCRAQFQQDFTDRRIDVGEQRVILQIINQDSKQEELNQEQHQQQNQQQKQQQ